MTSKNRALLARREALEAAIDEWHKEHRDKPHDPDAYRAFLSDIDYLVPEGPDFNATTRDVDDEITTIPGPQLVVPVNNARYAINAANASWGSLYDALYGTDVISDEAGYQLAGWHAWFDFQDDLLWLLVVAVIELSVRRRHKGRSLGRMPLVAGLIYGALLIDGGFWMINGHNLYMYDQLLWIFGFWAIEANLRSKQSSVPLMQS